MSLNNANILNIGWIGRGDFGDEAMAYALRRFLKQENAQAITYYSIGHYPRHVDTDDIATRHLYTSSIPLKLRSAADWLLLRRFNVLLIGGGSLFHSHNSIAWKMDVVRRFKRIGAKPRLAVAIGVTLGPFASKQDSQLCGKLLDMLDGATFRDAYSYEYARSISINQHLYQSYDTSLLLYHNHADIMKAHTDKQLRKHYSDTIGVMLVWKNNPRHQLALTTPPCPSYLRLINHIVARGFRVILFSLYRGSEYLDDQLTELLSQHVNKPSHIAIHRFNGDIFRTIHAIQQCRMIVSMRLHGILFAYMLRIPFLSIEYDPKNQYFCKSIHYPQHYVLDARAFENPKSLAKTFDTLKDDQTIFDHKTTSINETSKVVQSASSHILSLYH